jgi:glutathione reductase (NADPH)
MKDSDLDKKEFDLIVIGTGVAATTAAYKCKSAGWSVAIIDSRPFGGTCALRGCDPKKVLVGAADIVESVTRMKNYGISNENKCDSEKDPLIKIKWKELMNFKRTFTEPVPKNREESFHKAGITTFHGIAKFTAPNSIKIIENNNHNEDNNNNDILHNQNKFYNKIEDNPGYEGVGDREKVIEGKFILISTGSTPIPLKIQGKEHLMTSDQFLDLDNLPSKIVFVGGGYISFEFAHIAARAGSRVTILHRSEKPLSNFDSDLVNVLLQKSQDIGIDIKLNAPVNKIEKVTENPEGFLIYFSNNDKEGKNDTIKADLVVHGAGRVPNLSNLNLDVGNIKYDSRKGVSVNEYLQSISNSSVYSAGDVSDTQGLPLTPVASYEGEIVASNLLQGNHLKPNYKGIPSVVFTIPPLSSVGMLEEEAKEKGLIYKVTHQNSSNWYSSKRINEKFSAFKILIEESSQGSGGGESNNTENSKILGAHILGHNSEEVINIFALAIRLGLSKEKIKDMLFSYPTNSYDVNYML